MNFKDLKPCSFNPDRYLVSSEGLIWSRKSNKFLRLHKCKQGYLKITLHHNKVRKSFKVHRLVAMAFIPNPENKPEVNHIDGRKCNNFWTNLEWVTPKENMKHAKDAGILKSRKYKVSESTVRYIRELDIPAKDIAKLFKISVGYVYSLKSGRRRKGV